MTFSKSSQELIAVGSSYKTAPIELLESLSLDPKEISELLPTLKESFDLFEVLILSTCNRSEVYALSGDPAGDSVKIQNWLIDLSSGRAQMDPAHFYILRGSEAATHIFRVTSGLDAMILGETEITAQVQEALDIAKSAGTGSSYFIQLFSEAFRVSKRARNETALGSGTTSMASTAVHVARRVLGDLRDVAVMIVGAGETAKLVGKHLITDRPRKLIISNRTKAHADALAKELSAESVPFGEWDDVLPLVDVIICATRSKIPLITESMIRKAVGPKESKIIVLLDISLPHNIDKSVSKMDNVFLYDMDDLKHIVQKNLDRRAKESQQAERIIQEEQKLFFSKQSTIEMGPLIRDLRQSFEDMRKQELDRFNSRFSEADRSLADRLTKDLVNKLLHTPTVELRALSGELEKNREELSLVRRLFGLKEGSKSQ